VLVIGVVEDGKYIFLTERQKPAFFLPIAQWPDRAACLLLRHRSSVDEAYIVSALRRQIRDRDPSLPEDTQSWYTLMDLVLLPARAASFALGVLGFIGISLSVTGVSGMAAYSVNKRLRELGIRSALGASRAELLDNALGRALRLLGSASAMGLVLGLASSRLLSAIVYDPSPLDPLVLGGVVLVMTLLGLVATWVPARRALSISPGMLLRQE
jgi:ABC-type antimicrobial peptide transport system permease subunit